MWDNLGLQSSLKTMFQKFSCEKDFKFANSDAA